MMEFMGISVGILALICTGLLLFGRRGTVKILTWLAVLVVLGIVTVIGYLVWDANKVTWMAWMAAPALPAASPLPTSDKTIPFCSYGGEVNCREWTSCRRIDGKTVPVTVIGPNPIIRRCRPRPPPAES